ncbi:hypothetical protein J2S53_004483 [Actinopolyspora lacussalsi]|uniref:DUF397 domain-containing protein n=1 Tax=Actinopolyspora righensis TaxID=995060 RepID=A0A1I6YT39_9ACTN|nr:DUF397 domain-containing protein [Actinopolyspora righensis]MDP9644538.1 hypothetical protein [Actinopolyspora lacussalsi]SFT53642.1 protein of unknown function [Actinopolyspora righensis]
MSDIENSLLTAWRKSSRSGGGGTGGGNCVEVAFGKDFTAVRDSKSPDAGVLAVPAVQWRSFLDKVHSGHYGSGS